MTTLIIPPSAPPKRRSRMVVPLAALAALALVAIMISSVTSATWTDTTRNNANTWETATVSLTDDAAGVAMFTTDNMVPGSTVENSITVTNESTVTLDVRLYGENLVNSDTDDPLAQHLNVRIGTTVGAGDVFEGTLAGFAATHSSYASGTAVVELAPEEDQIYHFWIELDAATPPAFSEQTAGIDFVWEGQTQ